MMGWMRQHPPDRPTLERWLAVVKAAKWKRFVDIRSTFASVDRVTAGSGKPVFVFNIARNRFRLIAALHFNQQRIFTLRFSTHAEYDNENWKREL
jgi:mRNA interferase HigB